jgi:hypothetical protein
LASSNIPPPKAMPWRMREKERNSTRQFFHDSMQSRSVFAQHF